MKPERIYQHLKELCEKIDVPVSEQNLRATGISVQSGFCVVKGLPVFIMDKHQSIRGKIDILASWLAERESERLASVYTVPVVRELVERFRNAKENQ